MYFRVLFLMFLALLVSACGSGGGSGSGNNTGNTPTPKSIELIAASNTLLSADSTGVAITAYVKDSANAAMAGQTVTFSASSGIISAAQSFTDDAGKASVTLISGSDKTNRDITVAVKSGLVTSNLVISVTGSKISVSGDPTLQLGGAQATYSVSAVDSSGSPVRAASVSVVSSLGNVINPAVLTTDANGAATFGYTPNKAGTDTLVITALGAIKSSEVLVNSIDFVAVNPVSGALVNVGDPQLIKVRYRNSGAGVAGKTVTFTTTRGTFTDSATSAVAVTNVAGEASVTVKSATAGLATIIGQIANVGQVNLPIQFVATTPAAIFVQANPGSVQPNATGDANRSTIEAVVRDKSGNAVANQQVSFTVVSDITNGKFTSGRATTDANGRAQVQFIPGSATSEKDGVVISATVVGTDISSTTALTVSGRALFVTIGFGNTMSNLDETTYSKEFSVYVTDADGKAVANKSVTLSLFPTEYYKGYMTWSETDSQWLVTTTATCDNEDLNKSGKLESSPINEDINGDKHLTPGAVAVLVTGTTSSSTDGVLTTDSSGRGTFKVQYGEQYAPWAKVLITARAAVDGTEYQNNASYYLQMLLSDVKSQATPAGVLSPFGRASDCANAN